MELYRLLKQYFEVKNEPVYEYNVLAELIKSNAANAYSRSLRLYTESVCFNLLLGSRNHSTICLTHLCPQEVMVFKAY